MKNREKFDILIIGCGISGLSAAITASERGFSTAVISKEDELKECNTYYAQGGIVYKSDEDSPDLLFNDILNAGGKINSYKALKLLCNEGPGQIKEFLLDKIGVKFYKNEKNEIDRTKEAAHSVRRIIHSKDKTGEVIENTLLQYALKQKNIKFFNSHIAIELITNTHNSRDQQERYKRTKVIGAYILDRKREIVKCFFSNVVILATGGIGNLFQHTSNPVGATGDGVAMAYRLGAEIINSEYVQFHPTLLFHRDVERFLITEALRGEGAKLVNRKGEYFMSKYNNKQKDLAPRDEVTRAIFTEMENEDSGYMLLDATIIKNVDIKERFPSIYKKCKEVGIDIKKDFIPIVPAAHYFCGGIKTNIYGNTSIKGMYAIGENACNGIHGANRLASVSLLEGMFFGIYTIKNLSPENISSIDNSLINSIPDWIYPKEEESFEPILINNDLKHLQSIMWNYAGIIRTGKRLSRALSDLGYLGHRIERFYKQAKLTRKLIELRNSVLTATIIVRTASSNKKPIGCHYIE